MSESIDKCSQLEIQIDKCCELKAEMESAILYEIQHFESQTGMSVRSVDTGPGCADKRDSPVIGIVRCCVVLP